MVATALGTKLLRGQREVISEGTRERFVRAIPRIEGHAEDVVCSASDPQRRLAQALRANLAHERPAHGRGKRACEVKWRDMAHPGNILQRNGFARVTFHEPQGLLKGVHKISSQRYMRGCEVPPDRSC